MNCPVALVCSFVRMTLFLAIIFFKTFSPFATDIPTPINAKNAVIHVEDVVFSLRIKIENIEANIGEVARQNKINDTEVSATPYVKNIELNI